MHEINVAVGQLRLLYPVAVSLLNLLTLYQIFTQPNLICHQS